MDFILTHSFRLIVDDIVLIHDVFRLYRQLKPRDSRSIRGFTEALAYLVDAEAKSNIHVVVGNKDRLSNLDDEEKKKRFNDEIWSLVHSALILFSLDELSQFPFWAAKVSICTSSDYSSMNVIAAMFNALRSRFQRNGIISLYEGCVPYIAAAYVYNISYFYEKFKEFPNVFSSLLPRLPSSHSIGMSTPKSSLSRVRSRSSFIFNDTNNPMNFNSPDGGNYGGGSTLNSPSPNGDNAPPTYMSMAVERLAVCALNHPLLTLAVNMVGNPLLRGCNWMSATWRLASPSGSWTRLHRGLRSNMALSLVPWSPLCFMGVQEMIQYKYMLGQANYSDGSSGIWSVVRQIATGTVSDSASAALASTATSSSSSAILSSSSSSADSSTSSSSSLTSVIFSNVLKYGMLTLVQVLPGFVSFVCFRGLAYLVCGATPRRKKLLKFRHEVLEDYWLTSSTGSAQIPKYPHPNSAHK